MHCRSQMRTLGAGGLVNTFVQLHLSSIDSSEIYAKFAADAATCATEKALKSEANDMLFLLKV